MSTNNPYTPPSHSEPSGRLASSKRKRARIALATLLAAIPILMIVMLLAGSGRCTIQDGQIDIYLGQTTAPWGTGGLTTSQHFISFPIIVGFMAVLTGHVLLSIGIYRTGYKLTSLVGLADSANDRR